MPKPVVKITSTVAHARDLVGTTVGGQVALMSIEHGEYYGLNPVGSRIWELLVQPRTVAALCDQLVSEFEVERSQCEQQVMELLQKLTDANLVTVTDSPERESVER
jgi:hypothetical protein